MGPSPPLKILIAGAGLAGPAAAFWLSRIGCSVTVLERSPHLRATGQQIDITGQGLVLLRMMGIYDAVRAVKCPEKGMRVIDCLGNSKAFFPAGTAASPTQELEVMRGDLVGILYEATKNLKGVEYKFGSHVEKFTQDEEGVKDRKVHVTFSDGKTDDYDILIGADGFHSSTRTQLHGPAFPSSLHDLGITLSYFTAPSLPSDTTDWTMNLIPGGKCLMTRKDRAENIRVYLATRVSRELLSSAHTLAEQKQALVEIFKGSEAWQMERFLKDLVESREADDLYCQSVCQLKLPEGAWAKGRVVLLGDAAYCPAAIGGGIGTAASFVGAYVLAGKIGRQVEKANGTGVFKVAEAVAEYERIVRPFVEGKTGNSAWMMRMWLPESRVGIWGVQVMAGWVAKAAGWKGEAKVVEEEVKFEFEDYFGVVEGHQVN